MNFNCWYGYSLDLFLAQGVEARTYMYRQTAPYVLGSPCVDSSYTYTWLVCRPTILKPWIYTCTRTIYMYYIKLEFIHKACCKMIVRAHVLAAPRACQTDGSFEVNFWLLYQPCNYLWLLHQQPASRHFTNTIGANYRSNERSWSSVNPYEAKNRRFLVILCEKTIFSQICTLFNLEIQALRVGYPNRNLHHYTEKWTDFRTMLFSAW